MTHYFYEYGHPSNDDQHLSGRVYDVMGREPDGGLYVVAERCKEEHAQRIVECLNACEGVGHLSPRLLLNTVDSLQGSRAAQSLAESLWLEAKEKWAQAEERYFDLVEQIATLIPAIDGERANDPIINRVKRLATIENIGPRDRLHALFNDVCELCQILEHLPEGDPALAKLKEIHNHLFDYLWPQKEI